MVDPGTSFEEKFQAGKAAFEQGHYSTSLELLEEAVSLVNLGSRQGGEAQLWLVLAYQAAGQLKEAKSLCRKLVRHPQLDCRQQSKNILYILDAPALARPKSWLTEIPDLTQESLASPVYSSRPSARPLPPPPSPIYFEDKTKINTQENGFILVAIAVILGLLLISNW